MEEEVGSLLGGSALLLGTLPAQQTYQTLSLIKGHCWPFCTQTNLLGQPGLDRGGAVFSFPFHQRFVIAAFGFDEFTGVRIFINLQLTRLCRVPITEG
jgi:hypothetical protein